MWAYVRAEAVFFTHGLYGSPRPPRGRTVVNLWHGDGPKDLRAASGPGDLIASSHVVAGTRLFGEAKAEAFEVPLERLLLTGNPRTDQMFHPVSSDSLEALGITGGFVLWMPTFRTTRGSSVQKAWSEGGEVGLEEVAPLLALLRERGLQLVVKPHPMDAEDRRGPGVVTVTNEDLARVGVPLYALVGQAVGLVTDYSSIWADYLLLDRPMAFLVPDRDTYPRPLDPPDVLDWLPGEGVGAEAPFEEFVADLDGTSDGGAALRREVAERIGLVQSRTSADDLLDALVAAGALRL
jgi:CDP-glycerol glycerophosphotransferase (TagB/SpsB family)